MCVRVSFCEPKQQNVMLLREERPVRHGVTSLYVCSCVRVSVCELTFKIQRNIAPVVSGKMLSCRLCIYRVVCFFLSLSLSRSLSLSLLLLSAHPCDIRVFWLFNFFPHRTLAYKLRIIVSISPALSYALALRLLSQTRTFLVE